MVAKKKMRGGGMAKMASKKMRGGGVAAKKMRAVEWLRWHLKRK